MTTTTSFRLTFNRPAERQFFDQSSNGLRIRIADNDYVFFRPVDSVRGSKDSVVLETRGERGGKGVHFDGENAGKLLKILHKMGGSRKQPYFLLDRAPSRGDRGWFTISAHHESTQAPPKFTPHLRLWERHEPKREPPPTIINDAVADILGDTARLIRGARARIDAYRDERKIGRPTKEIKEATELLGAFELLSQEILPDRNPAEYLMRVNEAYVILGKVIHDYTPRADYTSFLSHEDGRENKNEQSPEMPAIEAEPPVATEEEEQASPPDHTPPEVMTVKKRRGRPRKYPLPDGSEAKDFATSHPVKPPDDDLNTEEKPTPESVVEAPLPEVISEQDADREDISETESVMGEAISEQDDREDISETESVMDDEITEDKQPDIIGIVTQRPEVAATSQPQDEAGLIYEPDPDFIEHDPDTTTAAKQKHHSPKRRGWQGHTRITGATRRRF